jgi:hypothetical protein
MLHETAILMSREESMVTSWSELLGLTNEGDGTWTLAVYGANGRITIAPN